MGFIDRVRKFYLAILIALFSRHHLLLTAQRVCPPIESDISGCACVAVTIEMVTEDGVSFSLLFLCCLEGVRLKGTTHVTHTAPVVTGGINL